MYELNYNRAFITGTDSDDNESRGWTTVERQTRSKTRQNTINRENFQQMNSSNKNSSLSRENNDRTPIVMSCKYFIYLLNSQFF